MKKDIPQLHAIRSMAMVGIFLHHLFQGIGPLREAYAGTLLGDGFQVLALGVVAFNVMTSFLASMPYVGPNPAPVPAVSDYLPKRLARLCPHYYGAVLLVILGNAVVYRITNAADWLPPALFHFLFLDPLRVQSFMSNTAGYWWLGLLVQYSLAFPLLLLLTRKYGLARVTIAVTVIVWPLTEVLKMLGRAEPGGLADTLAFLSTFNLPSRLPEFLIGMWMAELWKQRPGRLWLADAKLTWLIFGACALCLGFTLQGWHTPWFAGLAWTMAIFLALFSMPSIERLGQHKTMLWLSGASYAIYLLHQPVISWLDVAVASFWPWPKFLALGILGWYCSVQGAAWLDGVAARAGRKLAGKKKK